MQTSELFLTDRTPSSTGAAAELQDSVSRAAIVVQGGPWSPGGWEGSLRSTALHKNKPALYPSCVPSTSQGPALTRGLGEEGSCS